MNGMKESSRPGSTVGHSGPGRRGRASIRFLREEGFLEPPVSGLGSPAFASTEEGVVVLRAHPRTAPPELGAHDGDDVVVSGVCGVRAWPTGVGPRAHARTTRPELGAHVRTARVKDRA